MFVECVVRLLFVVHVSLLSLVLSIFVVILVIVVVVVVAFIVVVVVAFIVVVVVAFVVVVHVVGRSLCVSARRLIDERLLREDKTLGHGVHEGVLVPRARANPEGRNVM